jgi:hypothetical protein
VVGYEVAMKKTILVCDGCGVEDDPGTKPLFLQTGRSPDPAGGPSSPDGEDFDLCPTCLLFAFHFLLRKMDDWDSNKKLVAQLRERRKVVKP